MKSRRYKNQGFTLIELLLVVSIIAIMASLAVGVMGEAQNDAAVAATRSRINIIQQILESELEDYEVRRSPVPAGLANSIAAALAPGAGLVHTRNIRRMILADLIRAELPDGSRSGDEVIGRFPTDTLFAYFESLGIDRATVLATPGMPIRLFAGVDDFGSTLPAVDRWSRWQARTGWGITPDSNVNDGVDEEAADRSELLYTLLTGIDTDGTSAIDLLGGSAVGDTDGDEIPEVVDAWGEPIYLQWQQEWLRSVGDATTPDELADGVWRREQSLVGLSIEHHMFTAGDFTSPAVPITHMDPLAYYAMPVLPTQIRPFLVSERLLNINGTPADYQPGPDSWRSVQ